MTPSSGDLHVFVGPGSVTTIRDLAFAISNDIGDILADHHGLIVLDTRHLSRLVLTFDGRPVRGLVAGLPSADRARFRGYLITPHPESSPDAPVEVERDRRITGDGFIEMVTLTSWAPEPLQVRVGMHVDADFVDIFDVRRPEGAPRRTPPPVVSARRDQDTLTFTAGELSTEVRLPPGTGPDDPLEWTAHLARGRRWQMTFEVRAGSGLGSAAPDPVATPRMPPSAPAVRTDPDVLADACARSLSDLQAMCAVDPLDPDRRILTAGIPWFVALFGRDSLIASHLARAFDPGLMLETLHVLAARQGRTTDPGNEEAPGKILHEVRLTTRPWLGTGTTRGTRPYFGSIDATPLFLMLMGQAARWGAPREVLGELLPAARDALGWLRGDAADPDGDGLIEYRASGPRSLTNQSWKDSVNAVQFPDGSLADAPIAILEVQAYAVRARLDLAEVLTLLGQDGEADDLRAEADRLAAMVRDRYWVPRRGRTPGFFAMALDGHKRVVDSVSSNMGHALWCGIASPEQAAEVATHLVGEGLASGWGLRTLSSGMDGFNPISYHVGSVWPHDTAIAVEGLRRYGHDAAAATLTQQLLDACRMFRNRLPELFGGHPRRQPGFPVPYPSACRPQAWAAAAPLSLLTSMLGIEPDIPAGVISLAPILPPSITRLEVRGIAFPTGALSVTVTSEGAHLLERPDGVRVEFRPTDRDVVPPGG